MDNVVVRYQYSKQNIKDDRRLNSDSMCITDDPYTYMQTTVRDEARPCQCTLRDISCSFYSPSIPGPVVLYA